MRICKKILISICIVSISIMSLMPSTSNAAELNDAQRQAIVNVLKEVIDGGNAKGLLRYSQGHRTSGYSWTKVRGNAKQTTVSDFGLTPSDVERVLNALKEDVKNRYKIDSAEYKSVAAMTKLRKTIYKCRTIGSNISDTIAFDCSSLCCAAYNMAFGTKFMYSSGMFGTSSYFKKVAVTEAKPGDVLWKKGHVVIYLGACYNGDVKTDRDRNATYVAEAGGVSAKDKKAEISKVLADWLIANPTAIPGHPNYSESTPVVQLPDNCVRAVTKQVVIRKINLSSCEFTAAYRYVGEVKPGRVIDVSGTTTTNTGNGTGENVGGLTVEQVNNTKIEIGTRTTAIGYWPDNLSMEEQALVNSEGYFHKGIPAYGGYTQTTSTLTWLLEKASDVLDWIAGFITMGIKAQIIGWTAIVENLISNALAWGTQNIDNQTADGTTGSIVNDTVADVIHVNIPIVTTNKVTIEDIIFNKVPLLDINFFDLQTAGGQQLEQGSIIYNIRAAIAGWYYAFRTIAIIMLLIALLYNIVKLIGSSVISEKTSAKSKIKDWLIAFIIVFGIHYLMLGIINMNNQIIRVLEPIGVAELNGSVDDTSKTSESIDIDNGSITQNNERSLYEQIRVLSYDVKATTGWAATFMYVIMVIYLFMFLLMYIKRLFITAILTVIAPLVAAMYAINKKSSSMNLWVKEYTYNVLIQLVHVIIYTVLVSVALSLAQTSTFVGGLLTLVIIGFIFKAEGIVKRILNYNSSELGDLSGSLGAQIGMYFATVKTASWLGGTTTSMAKNARRFMEKPSNNPEKAKAEAAERAKQQGILDRGYETMTAKANARMDILGETIKRAYSGEKNGDSSKGILDLHGELTRDNYKSLYEQYLREQQIASYRGTPTLQKQVERWKKESNAAQKEYIKNRARGVANSVIATAGITVGVPLLFIESLRGRGMAITAGGMNAYLKTFSRRRILGAKSYQHHLRGNKFLFFFASPALAKGYKNAAENIIEERAAYLTTYGEVLDTLEQAKRTEATIIMKMMDMYSNRPQEERPFTEYEEKLRKRVQEIEEKEFDKAVEKASAIVSEQSVEEVIKDYLKENKKSKLSVEDFYDIRERINRKLKDNGNEVEVSDSFTNNIRDQVRRKNNIDNPIEKIVKDAEGNEKVELKARVELKDIAKICREVAKDSDKKLDDESIKDMIYELRRDKGFIAVMKTQNTDIIIEKVEQKLEEKIKDNELAKELSESFKEKMDKHIDEKTEKQEKSVDEIISKMKSEEAADILTKAINYRNGMTVSLKNVRYNDLMQDIRKLEELNNQYYELTDEKIYKNVNQVVSQIRKGIISDRRGS